MSQFRWRKIKMSQMFVRTTYHMTQINNLRSQSLSTYLGKGIYLSMSNLQTNFKIKAIALEGMVLDLSILYISQV